jgi:hypothetical protein
MVIRNQIAAPVGPPPPDVPHGVEAPLSDYLRRFATWANQQLAAKIGSRQAVPGVMLISPSGKVWRVIVNDAGVMATELVPPGSPPP